VHERVHEHEHRVGVEGSRAGGTLAGMAITAPFVHPMTGHLPHPDPARLPPAPGPGPRTLKRQTDSRDKYAPERIVVSLLAFRRFPPATA
jgi:hypothetical protein